MTSAGDWNTSFTLVPEIALFAERATLREHRSLHIQQEVKYHTC